MIPRFSVVSFFKSFFRVFNQNWTFYLLVIFGGIHYFLFNFLRWNQYDSKSYIAGAKYLFNLDGGAIIQNRLSKPIPLFIPGFFEYLCNFPAKFGFILQSGFFFFLLIYGWKAILKNLGLSESTQRAGVLMLLLSQTLASFSFSILTDIPGWFFMTFLIFLTTHHKLFEKKWLIYSTMLIGIYVKESIFVGILFYLFYVAFNSNYSPSKKVREISVVVLLIIISQVLLMYLNTGTLVERQFEIIQWGHVFEIHKFKELLQIWRAFDGFWILFIFSFLYFFKRRKFNHLNNTIVLSLLFSMILLPIVHPAFLTDRIIFMIYPLIYIPILLYLEETKFEYGLELILTLGIISTLSTYFIYRYNTNGLFGISFICSWLSFLLVYRKRTN